MIFAKEINDPLTSLVKQVNTATYQWGRGISSYAVFCSEDANLEKHLF
jgi:hypothetical protein